MAVLLAFLLLVQPAYVLDHPIDPDLLILATSNGRYPFALIANSDCSWVHSDMNVMIEDNATGFWRLSDGTHECAIAVRDRVDATPCYANADGQCDIDSGEHYWPDVDVE